MQFYTEEDSQTEHYFRLYVEAANLRIHHLGELIQRIRKSRAPTQTVDLLFAHAEEEALTVARELREARDQLAHLNGPRPRM